MEGQSEISETGFVNIAGPGESETGETGTEQGAQGNLYIMAPQSGALDAPEAPIVTEVPTTSAARCAPEAPTGHYAPAVTDGQTVTEAPTTPTKPAAPCAPEAPAPTRVSDTDVDQMTKHTMETELYSQ